MSRIIIVETEQFYSVVSTMHRKFGQLKKNTSDPYYGPREAMYMYMLK